jgi:hypothetical protein
MEAALNAQLAAGKLWRSALRCCAKPATVNHRHLVLQLLLLLLPQSFILRTIQFPTFSPLALEAIFQMARRAA